MRQLLPVIAALLATSCVPWTVRPIGEGEAKSFDPKAYVDSIWDARLIPALGSKAVDIQTARAARRPALVKGAGKVIAVEAQSQAARVAVDLAPGDGRADAFVQLGPVIRGTALRDAAGFMDFGQFTNQLDYAAVSNELNARALRAVGRIEPQSLKGATITFTGAASFPEGAAADIVPVSLRVEGR